MNGLGKAGSNLSSTTDFLYDLGQKSLRFRSLEVFQFLNFKLEPQVPVTAQRSAKLIYPAKHLQVLELVLK